MKPKQIKGVPEQKSGGFHDTETYVKFEKALIPLKYEALKSGFSQSINGRAIAEKRLQILNSIHPMAVRLSGIHKKETSSGSTFPVPEKQKPKGMIG
jgi:hypothetical protein